MADDITSELHVGAPAGAQVRAVATDTAGLAERTAHMAAGARAEGDSFTHLSEQLADLAAGLADLSASLNGLARHLPD